MLTVSASGASIISEAVTSVNVIGVSIVIRFNDAKLVI